MIVKSKDQLDKEEQDLLDEGVKFHTWKDTVNMIGTGKDNVMTKGRRFTRVHKLIAPVLEKKGYATVTA